MYCVKVLRADSTFADDTNIFYSHTDPSYLIQKGYLLMIRKSNFIIFRPRQNKQTLDQAFNISNYS